jgi:hypothetical protein
MHKAQFTSVVMIIGCFLAYSSLYAAGTGPPVPFSADYLELSDGLTSQGKYFASPQGIRMEGMSEGEPLLMIVNFSQNVSWMVQVQDRMYVEMPFDPDDSDTFVTPCPELKKAKRIGRETLHGRSVERWHCENWNGKMDSVWFDERLKVTVRSEDADGDIFELRNIKEGRLSGDLFQLPAGYTKIEMPMSW